MDRSDGNMMRLKAYARLFSRQVFVDVLKYDDFSEIDFIASLFDKTYFSGVSYADFLKYAYSEIRDGFRCEYVFKNEFINNFILRNYNVSDTLTASEFKIDSAIADLAVFNGESKAFEIKTEYDSPKRLQNQMRCYDRLFQRRYLVIRPEDKDLYLNHIDDNTGVILMHFNEGGTEPEVWRESALNVDAHAMTAMHVMTSKEYKDVVYSEFGRLPDVSCYEMFECCLELIKGIPSTRLHSEVLRVMHGRKSISKAIDRFPSEFRQMILSLQLNEAKSQSLMNKLEIKMTI